MRKDRQATIDKQFLDPRSYVTLDGREVLYGEDWKARVEDLRLRSQGKCEHVGDYFSITEEKFVKRRCLMDAADPDHIIKRSTRRDDRLSNLQALCRWHHEQKHPEKQLRWTQRERVAERREQERTP